MAISKMAKHTARNLFIVCRIIGARVRELKNDDKVLKKSHNRQLAT